MWHFFNLCECVCACMCACVLCECVGVQAGRKRRHARKVHAGKRVHAGKCVYQLIQRDHPIAVHIEEIKRLFELSYLRNRKPRQRVLRESEREKVCVFVCISATENPASARAL